MDLDPLVVVYVQIVALGRCKHRVVLQEAHIIDLFFGLKFHDQVFLLPIEHSQVAFAAS